MFWQSVKMAWEAIAGNKMRSFLTMLGIIIGVMALVVMVSLVSGATGQVTSEIESLGTNQITAYIFDDKGKPVKLNDLAEIGKDPSVGEIAPMLNANYAAKRGHTDEMVNLYGTTAAYGSIAGLNMAYGRFLKTVDVENSSYVAVLTYDAADVLFGRQDVVGETLRIGGRAFTVVGVQEKVTSAFAAFSFTYNVYVPYSVLQRMTGTTAISTIYVSAANTDSETSAAAEAALRGFLDERFGTSADSADSYYVDNINAIMDTMSTVTSTMQLLLGGIAAISLLVGGIGIMNIMLVSVTERTHEIGIRKAIGAGRGTIMMQFLIEALMVSLFGCIIGLLLSSGILKIVTAIAANSVAGISFAMSPRVVLIAAGFSSAIGLIFGLYPANKAAKMPPIEALRYQG